MTFSQSDILNKVVPVRYGRKMPVILQSKACKFYLLVCTSIPASIYDLDI